MDDGLRNRNVRVAILVTALVALLLLPFACGPSVRRALNDGDDDDGVVAADGGFTIEGSSTAPITPGISVPLDLEITNLHDAALSVTDLAVTVREVQAPNAEDALPCSARDFALDQVSADLEITLAANTTSTLRELTTGTSDAWPQVGMLDRPVNQDGCKGALLTLDYTGSGALQS